MNNRETKSTIPITSPCVRNCCLDEHDICLGCYRTLDEILAWGSASNEQRALILSRCEKRCHNESHSDHDKKGI
ncbi:hypothetical protein PSECIP111951_02246 [Pseudoalteromonas holothuriae]|uniref:DUF1289 domain-containing protein n=1 Tax=Pseudoalteromonas holothuriae TaxID=2963714 RepID=A0A9W4W0K9_9GAMM|nr:MULTISPECIES: DUF1289 domain-containing protein [unclassified Pseudoalteromonas]CAH9060278.1 hypothetical protein PSECIP111951_02246 [Pseudoalteromonas sp. CIP111951]CAH9060450.1 hypothetical protein PSECIP111854_02606 [Pseudoalteromonas sp. CIP111854]